MVQSVLNAAADLDEFSRLLELELDLFTDAAAEKSRADVEIRPVDSLFPVEGCFHRGRITRSSLSPSEQTILICCNNRQLWWWKRRLQSLCLWQAALTLAVMNASLRGTDAVLVHCAVLETERGAVVVFGESGMGKSTVSERWRACGGKCVSDDMALLDFSGENQIYVRRMPTWSVCRDGKNKWNYPAGEELPLAGVLALGRSETGQDEIVELSMAQFFAQCYRSMFYWNLLYAEGLPEEKKTKLTDRIRHLTEIITGRFPPLALLTVLEGNNLRSVIETYLNTI